MDIEERYKSLRAAVLRTVSLRRQVQKLARESQYDDLAEHRILLDIAIDDLGLTLDAIESGEAEDSMRAVLRAAGLRVRHG